MFATNQSVSGFNTPQILCPSKSAEERLHAIPDANVEPLAMLDVTSMQGPPPSVIVSIVPASRTMTEEHVPDALFLPSSLFSVDAGVVVDMAYNKPRARGDAAAEIGQDGGWQTALGDGNRGASRAGLHAIRAVDGKEVPDGRGAQDGFGGLLPVRVGPLVLTRVKLDAAPSRKKKRSRIEVWHVLVLAVG